jgi:hypothetical protein
MFSLSQGKPYSKREKLKKIAGGERKNGKEVCFLFFGYDISSCSQLAFLPVSTAYF